MNYEIIQINASIFKLNEKKQKLLDITKLRENLKDLQERKKISNEELGKIGGCSSMAIYYFLSGQTQRPNKKTIERLEEFVEKIA